MYNEKPKFTAATWNDAGLLREYVATHYGHFFTFGASSETAARAMRCAGRLGRLTGRTVNEIADTARTDYALLEDAREAKGGR